MATLLLRLAAPLQAWGYDSKFDVRQTGSEPSKSGVIGLLAAALGMRRDADLSRFAALRFGVRTDSPGVLLRDFHTAKSAKSAYVTNRYYLSDAKFLVGLESDDEAFLQELAAALRNPRFPLFLGRRSCPPTLPLVLSIRDTGLEQALQAEPPIKDSLDDEKKPAEQLKIQLEAAPGEGAAMKKDLPLSFNPNRRLYGYRKVKEIYMEPVTQTEHDAMSELEGM